MQSHAQILGWHRLAVAPSLQIFVEGNRLLFNAGENVQRFHLEHKLHLARTTDVFLTSVAAATSAGLPGLLLTLDGAGVAERPRDLRLWGPPDLPDFLETASRAFAGLRHLNYEYHLPPSTFATDSRAASPLSSSTDGCETLRKSNPSTCRRSVPSCSYDEQLSKPSSSSSVASAAAPPPSAAPSSSSPSSSSEPFSHASVCLRGVAAGNVQVHAYLLPHSLSTKGPRSSLGAFWESPNGRETGGGEGCRSTSSSGVETSAIKNWGNPLFGDEAEESDCEQTSGEDLQKKHRPLGAEKDETNDECTEETERKKKRILSPDEARRSTACPSTCNSNSSGELQAGVSLSSSFPSSLASLPSPVSSLPSALPTSPESMPTEAGGQLQTDSGGKKDESERRSTEKNAGSLRASKWQGEQRDQPRDCVAYVLSWPQIPGKFFPDKAKALRVPVGPLFGRLKNGESIEVPGEGRIVTPDQVCGPGTPGQMVVVIECVEPQQATLALERLNVDLDRLTFVFHMSPPSVLHSEEYTRFVKAVTGSLTRHVIVNQSGSPVDVSPFVHASKLRRFLHDLIPPVFPFPSSPVPLPSKPSAASGTLSHSSSLFSPIVRQSFSDLWGVEDASVIYPHSLVKFDLSTLEKRGTDASGSLTVFGPQFSPERLSRLTALEATRARCREIISALSGPSDSSSSSAGAASPGLSSVASSSALPYSSSWSLPSLTLLGTGAAAPSQYRNVSGLLVALRKDLSLVLDFGEGSLAQLYSMCHSWEEFLNVISSIRVVFISHCHADHHLGVCCLLEFRAAMFPELLPPLVIAPAKLQAWLSFYDCRVTRIPHRFRSTETIVGGLSETSRESEKNEEQVSAFRSVSHLLGVEAGDLRLRATPVNHIPHSFGLRVDFEIPATDGKSRKDFSVVYSGDTRPCPQLFNLARNATVLIHEATFEDALMQEAIEKRHSSLSEVVRGALDCRCANLVLTHFSQRYPKIPVLTLEAGGDAFLVSDSTVAENAEKTNAKDVDGETGCTTKAPITVFSKQKREGDKDPMHILFAFDCMRLPLKHLQELSQCLELLPAVINQLFVSE
ncbi:UNVERIFIED_CONTAM: ribonuclease z, putative [Hammondia hammondi]|eukprot:XP_008885519.1 ribonuclease z, putative [Hammondia hammondi]